jgi:hypothetical protein
MRTGDASEQPSIRTQDLTAGPLGTARNHFRNALTACLGGTNMPHQPGHATAAANPPTLAANPGAPTGHSVFAQAPQNQGPAPSAPNAGPSTSGRARFDPMLEAAEALSRQNAASSRRRRGGWDPRAEAEAAMRSGAGASAGPSTSLAQRRPAAPGPSAQPPRRADDLASGAGQTGTRSSPALDTWFSGQQREQWNSAAAAQVSLSRPVAASAGPSTSAAPSRSQPRPPEVSLAQVTQEDLDRLGRVGSTVGRRFMDAQPVLSPEMVRYAQNQAQQPPRSALADERAPEPWAQPNEGLPGYEPSNAESWQLTESNLGAPRRNPGAGG